jgi:hypothetical protein
MPKSNLVRPAKQSVRDLIRKKLIDRRIQVCEFIKRAGLTHQRYYTHTGNIDLLTLGEIKRIDMILKFTDEELLKLLRG